MGSEHDRKYIHNFLLILRRRKQMKLLPKIIDLFEEEWIRKQGGIRLEAEYATSFENSLEELEKALGRHLEGEVHIKSRPSDELIGGYRLMLGDTMIDASLRGRLNTLKDKLAGN